MCLSVQPTHIHPYIRKSRLLLEISGCINELCLQWVPYIPGTTATVCSVAWKRKPAARLIQEEGLMYALYNSRIGSQLSPRSPGGPQVRPEHELHNIPKSHCKHEHISISACFPRPNTSRSFLGVISLIITLREKQEIDMIRNMEYLSTI